MSRVILLACVFLFPITAALAAPPPDDIDEKQTGAVDLGTLDVVGALPAPGELQLEDIKAEQSLTPGGVSVIDGEKLQERAVHNMADVLRYVPGVMATNQTGGDDVHLHIRGSNLDSTDYDNNGVLLLQDGLPVTTADGNNHNRMLDINAARDVIIARGANALKYGASNLGGAIDFITPTARNSNPNQVFIHGGSFSTIGGGASIGGISGDLDGMVSVDGQHRHGYREHSRGRRVGIHANGGWRASDDLEFRLYTAYIDSKQELAGGLTRAQFEDDPQQADPSYVAGDHQLNVKTWRVAGKGTWYIDDDSKLEFGLSYEQQKLFHPIVTSPFFSLLIDTTQRTVGGMVRYNLKVGNHNILVGTNLAFTTDRGGNYENDAGHRGTLENDVNTRADSETLYVLDRWQFAPKWTLVYGAQGVFTGRDDRVIDQQERYSAFNPRVGLIYAFSPDNEAYASISRLFEAPDNFALDNARQERGNEATLDPMHGWVYEIGLRGDREPSPDTVHWHWDVSAYYARIRNEILSVHNPAPPPDSLTTNIDRTTHAGIEVLMSASFPLAHGRIEPLVSATYSHFTFDDDPDYGNNHMPVVPRYAVHSQVLYRDDSGLYAGPTLDYVGARYGDFSNTYHVDSYTLVGLRAGFRHKHWELFAEGRNLFNKDYISDVTPQDTAGTDAAILMPGAPRSVFVGARYKF